MDVWPLVLTYHILLTASLLKQMLRTARSALQTSAIAGLDASRKQGLGGWG